jgi:hypothetical protein
MQSLGPSGKTLSLYRPVLAPASIITPVPYFAGDKQKAISLR